VGPCFTLDAESRPGAMKKAQTKRWQALDLGFLGPEKDQVS
jgi:hypothetical protein